MELFIVAVVAVVLAAILAYSRGYGKLIDLSEPVDNSVHKFGEIDSYFKVEVVTQTGERRVALFTRSQIEVALGRADRNPEDV